MSFHWWHLQRITSGIRAYGLIRTIEGVINVLKLKIASPSRGSVTTGKDKLIFTFMYPEQFSYSLVLFQEFAEPEFELLRHLFTKERLISKEEIFASPGITGSTIPAKDIPARDVVFFDVGGAIGTYTIFAAKLQAGAIHTFEPVDENIQTIKENLSLNQLESCVRVNAVALSDQEGSGQLQRGSTFFYSHLQTDSQSDEIGASPEEVIVTTLYAYCQKNQIHHIDILKIDTEGHTSAILRGAQSLLTHQQIDLLIIEMDDDLIENRRLLRTYGYECFAYDAQRNMIHRLSATDRSIFAEAKLTSFHSNVIFIHPTALQTYQKYVTVQNQSSSGKQE